MAHIDDGVLQSMITSVVAKVSFEEAGFDDTEENRKAWEEVKKSIAALPKGVGVAMTKEWPDDDRFSDAMMEQMYGPDFDAYFGV